MMLMSADEENNNDNSDIRSLPSWRSAHDDGETETFREEQEDMERDNREESSAPAAATTGIATARTPISTLEELEVIQLLISLGCCQDLHVKLYIDGDPVRM
jgi:hypothetical protein